MRDGLHAKHAAEIRGLFGRIVPRYDLLNRLLSLGLDRGWREAVAERLEGGAEQRILDVCTGTGDLALACAARAELLASDFSLPMVAAARRKARSRISLFAADALRLPLVDGALDAVTVAFGVRNFESLGQGLAELVRVLRPGGTLLVLEFSKPQGLLAPLLRWWMRHAPPLLGRVVSSDGEAYAYLSASVRGFPSGERLCHVMEESGLAAVAATSLSGGVVTLYQGTKPARTCRPGSPAARIVGRCRDSATEGGSGA